MIYFWSLEAPLEERLPPFISDPPSQAALPSPPVMGLELHSEIWLQLNS